MTLIHTYSAEHINRYMFWIIFITSIFLLSLLRVSFGFFKSFSFISHDHSWYKRRWLMKAWQFLLIFLFLCLCEMATRTHYWVLNLLILRSMHGTKLEQASSTAFHCDESQCQSIYRQLKLEHGFWINKNFKSAHEIRILNLFHWVEMTFPVAEYSFEINSLQCQDENRSGVW